MKPRVISPEEEKLLRENEHLTIKEMAELIGKEYGLVRRFVNNHKIPHAYIKDKQKEKRKRRRIPEHLREPFFNFFREVTTND